MRRRRNKKMCCSDKAKLALILGGTLGATWLWSNRMRSTATAGFMPFGLPFGAPALALSGPSSRRWTMGLIGGAIALWALSSKSGKRRRSR